VLSKERKKHGLFNIMLTQQDFPIRNILLLAYTKRYEPINEYQ
jgi:hypothetical protein